MDKGQLGYKKLISKSVLFFFKSVFYSHAFSLLVEML